MIEVVRCKNGHYYDKTTYKECPHCKYKVEDSKNITESKREIAYLAQRYLESVEKRTEKVSLELFNENDQKTVSYTSVSRENYMITGWIVCIEGPDIGYSYNLHYGYNTIGSDLSNQICLSIKAENRESLHCAIVYEEHKNQFFLVAEQKQEVYLNENCCFEPMLLKSGDMVRIGMDKFQFVAFCCEQRKWNLKK